MRGAEHLRHAVPFAWMGLMDRLEALKQARVLAVPLDRFVALCAEAGMPTRPQTPLAAEAELALRFLGRLGLLFHHPSVPHLVVLRPAEFLFPYFTKVLRLRRRRPPARLASALPARGRGGAGRGGG